MARHHTERMGYNPFRAHRQSATDIVIVVVAMVVIAALVAWAFFG
jgi:hypothetical protein